jgi:TolA-binding protein
MWPTTKSLDWYLEQQRAVGASLKRLGALVMENRLLAIGVGLGIVALAAGIVGYRIWGRTQEEKAANLLFNAARQLASRGTTAEDVKQQEEAITLLRDVMSRYPGTAAAAEATLRLGNLYYGQERYDEARTTFEAYLAGNPRGRIAFSAGLGIADAYLAQKKYDMAAAAYLRLIGDFPREPLLPEAYFNLARTYVSVGKLQDALRLYERVAEGYPNTAWAQNAQAQIRRLRLPR